MAKFCEKCTNYEDGGCEILFRTMIHQEQEPEYPKEWIYKNPDDIFSGTCTAYAAVKP